MGLRHCAFLSLLFPIREAALVCSVRTLAGSTLANNGAVVSFADGVGTCAQFSGPKGLALVPSGDSLAVADQYNNLVRRFDLKTLAVTTLAGNSTRASADGGPPAAFCAASVGYPSGLVYTSSGALIISDFGGAQAAWGGHRLRVLSGGALSTLAGSGATPRAYVNGPGAAATFNRPYGLAVDGSDNVYCADSFNHAIRVITPQGVVSTLAGQLTSGAATPSAATGGYSDGVGTAAAFLQPTSVQFHASMGTLFVADTSNAAVRAIVVATGATTTLAGAPAAPGYADGVGFAAAFSTTLRGLALSPGGYLLVGDSAYVRAVDFSGAVTTLAGNGSLAWRDGWGGNSSLSWPNAIVAVDASTAIVADTNNNVLRALTCAATGWPYLITLDKQGAPGYAWPQVELAELGAFSAGDGSGANRLAAGGPCASSALFGANQGFSGCQNAVDGDTGNFFLTDSPAPWGSFSASGDAPIGALVVWPRTAVPERIGAARLSIINTATNETLWSSILGNVSTAAPILLSVPAAAFLPRVGLPCPQCPPGFACGGGAPALCPPGTYCPANASFAAPPLACPAGTYSGASGASLCANCAQCPRGAYCPPASAFPTPCAPGTFSEATGLALCAPCPAGTFSRQAGAVACQSCPAGRFCPAGASSWARRSCGRGNYCPEGAAAPIPCPIQGPPAPYASWAEHPASSGAQGPAFLDDSAGCLGMCFWASPVMGGGGSGLLGTC